MKAVPQTQEPQRVLHVTQFMAPKRGGTEAYVDAASLPFAALGHEVVQLGPTRSPSEGLRRQPHAGDPRVTQILVPELSTVSPDGSRDQRVNPVFLAPFERADADFYRAALLPTLQSLAPDHVFVHMVGPALAKAVLDLTPGAKSRFYLPHIHLADPAHPPAVAMRQAMQLPGWNGILASSNWHQKQLLTTVQPSARVIAVSPAIDLAMFRSPHTHEAMDALRRPGGLLLLSPSRVTAWKGQMELVRAIPTFLQRGIDVQVVLPDNDEFQKLDWSAPTDARALHDEIYRLKIDDRVHFLPLAGASMAAAMHSADAVVVTSHQGGDMAGETFCISAMEALAAGRPLATTLSGGIADYVQEGYNGAVIAVADGETGASPTSIVDAVQRAVLHGPTFGRNGRKTAASFSTEALTAQFASLMDGNGLRDASGTQRITQVRSNLMSL